MRETTLAALAMHTSVRAEPSNQPVTAVEQSILLMSAFTTDLQGDTPSQWPLNFDSFFNRLCPSSDQRSHEWRKWASNEERTRTAFGFYFINLFRHLFTSNAETQSSAPTLAGRSLPAPYETWYAISEEDWKAAIPSTKLTCDSLATQFLRKANERPRAVCGNALYMQVALLRQAYFEMPSSRGSGSSGVSNASRFIQEEGFMLTTQLDSVFSLARNAQPAIRLWKPEIYSLFLHHHVLALTRHYPVSVLYDIAEADTTLALFDDASAAAQQKQREQARIQLWRASHVLQAIQKGTFAQRQQLIVPYALFISVMILVSLAFLCMTYAQLTCSIVCVSDPSYSERKRIIARADKLGYSLGYFRS